MRLLLDTHTFLWFVEDSPKLSVDMRVLLEDDTNDLFLSVGSLWEMGIKVSTGKLAFDAPFEVLLPQLLSLNRMILLDIAVSHILVISSLRFHHKDPFDRLLVAQSLIEQIPIVSIDPTLDAYGITRLW